MSTIKRIGFILSVVCLIQFLPNPHPIQAQMLEKAVTITAFDEDENSVLPLTVIEIEENHSAFDILLKAANQYNLEISYDETDYGPIITAIDHKSKEQYFWSFVVNGKNAEVGTSAYEVKHGDHLIFALTHFDHFSSTIQATVSIEDTNGKKIINNKEVALHPQSSAYDALYQAVDSLDVGIDQTYFTFIHQISGIPLKDNEYWHVSVNGAPLHTSIVEMHLKDGDHIDLAVQSWNSEDKHQSNQPVDDDEKENPTVPVDKKHVQITDSVIHQQMNRIIDYVRTRNIKFVLGNEWWIWGLAHIDYQVISSYKRDVIEKIKENEGKFTSIYDLEKAIIGLSAVGEDATSVATYNLVDSMLNHPDMKMENPSINAVIYGLLALDSGDYVVAEEVRSQLVQSIINAELPSGGWSWFGNKPSVDMTAMAITALAPYKSNSNVHAVINRAIDYLSETMDEAGGYDDEWNGGNTSESTAQAIIGLVSNGINPTSDRFTTTGGNLLQHLIKYNDPNGGFKHVINDPFANDISTAQALLALVSYQKFINNDGLIYQYTVERKYEKDKESGKSEVNQEQATDNIVIEETKMERKIEKQQVENLLINKTKRKIGKKLPNTSTNVFNFMVVGVILLLIGIIILNLVRKKVK